MQPWAPAVSIRYVVDASVAGAANRRRAGEAATARRCRTYMLTIMTACHRIVMTDDLKREWDHRGSNWSKDFYLQMVRKGKVRWVVPEDCSAIEASIDDSDLSDPQKHAMLKDIRLVAAALPASRRIVTLDQTSIDLFGLLSESVGRLEVLVWTNPLDGSLPPNRR